MVVIYWRFNVWERVMSLGGIVFLWIMYILLKDPPAKKPTKIYCRETGREYDIY